MKKTIDALVQNYRFKRITNRWKLPSVDFVYPSYTADGNSEAFRLSPELRTGLAARAEVVWDGLEDRDTCWTSDEKVLLEVGKVAPRLGIEEQITRKINSVYSYSPLLFAGFGQNEVNAYVVKPIVNGEMAWFELTPDETGKVGGMLERMAQERPYRNIIQRVMGKKT
ncbi:hypothetical protein FJZ18_01490 [Candidatus Pacearchaeota archaeon]|nr:hypothetical protein [Candidatus Pacearchaeota archaeon]